MEQHAIPQNITSYQFRLIGDMTVKQFVELAAGILLAWAIGSGKMYPVIRLPLALGSGLFGAALAFLPFEERPLDVWIKNFFASIFKPTMFGWKKKPIPIVYKEIKTSLPAAGQPSHEELSQKLAAYLQTINVIPLTSPLDQAEQTKLQSVSSLLFQINHLSPSMVKASVPVPQSDKPIISPPPSAGGVRVRKLNPANKVSSQKVVFQIKNTTPSAAVSPPPLPTLSNRTQPPDQPFILQPIEEVGSKIPPVTQAPALAPPLKVESLYPDYREPVQHRTQALYDAAMQMPLTTNQPNLLVGTVVGPDDKIIPGAVLEIKNSFGETVRALKTNKLGQFFTATPLENNTYSLLVEHPDWDFDIINLEMLGTILSPLKIIAKRKPNLAPAQLPT
jgi:hypothetical protein